MRYGEPEENRLDITAWIMANNSSLWEYYSTKQILDFQQVFKGQSLPLHSPDPPTESTVLCLAQWNSVCKSLLADAVMIPSPSLEAAALIIKSEVSTIANTAPDLNDTFEILAPWFAQSHSELAD